MNNLHLSMRSTISPLHAYIDTLLPPPDPKTQHHIAPAAPLWEAGGVLGSGGGSGDPAGPLRLGALYDAVVSHHRHSTTGGTAARSRRPERRLPPPGVVQSHHLRQGHGRGQLRSGRGTRRLARGGQQRLRRLRVLPPARRARLPAGV
eukprot:9482574-Pyramimonas_sp.AAC.1